MIAATQISHTFIHSGHTNKCTRLYSTYELTYRGSLHRVKIEQLWNHGGSSKAMVWSPRDLEWKGVASFRDEWPKPQWSWACWGSRLNPAVDREKLEGKEAIAAHNQLVIQQDREIAISIEMETLKQACWVLFGVNEKPALGLDKGSESSKMPSDRREGLWEPRWCYSNECEHPECHRCNPQKDCEFHDKCQEQGR